jgi:hypothetical protein
MRNKDIPVYFEESPSGKPMDTGPWYLNTVPRTGETVIHTGKCYKVKKIIHYLKDSKIVARLKPYTILNDL